MDGDAVHGGIVGGVRLRERKNQNAGESRCGLRPWSETQTLDTQGCLSVLDDLSSRMRLLRSLHHFKGCRRQIT